MDAHVGVDHIVDADGLVDETPEDFQSNAKNICRRNLLHHDGTEDAYAYEDNTFIGFTQIKLQHCHNHRDIVFIGLRARGIKIEYIFY